MSNYLGSWPCAIKAWWLVHRHATRIILEKSRGIGTSPPSVFKVERRPLAFIFNAAYFQVLSSLNICNKPWKTRRGYGFVMILIHRVGQRKGRNAIYGAPGRFWKKKRRLGLVNFCFKGVWNYNTRWSKKKILCQGFSFLNGTTPVLFHFSLLHDGVP